VFVYRERSRRLCAVAQRSYVRARCCVVQIVQRAINVLAAKLKNIGEHIADPNK